MKKHYPNAFVRTHGTGKMIDTGFVIFPVCGTTKIAWGLARDLVKEDLKDQSEKYPQKSLTDIRFDKTAHLEGFEFDASYTESH